MAMPNISPADLIDLRQGINNLHQLEQNNAASLKQALSLVCDRAFHEIDESQRKIYWQYFDPLYDWEITQKAREGQDFDLADSSVAFASGMTGHELYQHRVSIVTSRQATLTLVCTVRNQLLACMANQDARSQAVSQFCTAHNAEQTWGGSVPNAIDIDAFVHNDQTFIDTRPLTLAEHQTVNYLDSNTQYDPIDMDAEIAPLVQYSTVIPSPPALDLSTEDMSPQSDETLDGSHTPQDGLPSSPEDDAVFEANLARALLAALAEP